MTTKIKGIVAPINAQSIVYTEATGITPTQVTEGMYLNNMAAVNMTNILLPVGVTDSRVILLGANGNTTLYHGLGMILKGAANVVLPANGIIALMKFSAHSTAWIEQYRNF